MAGNAIQVGDLTIHRIVEQDEPLFDPLEFFPSLTRDVLEENRPWLEAAGALDRATGKLVLPIQSYLVRTPRHTILVDTCVGNDKPRPARAFWNMLKGDAWQRGLAAAGARVEDIDYVMCTHLHVDHVGWNTRLQDGRWVPTFPNARYVFGEKEFAHCTPGCPTRCSPTACCRSSKPAAPTWSAPTWRSTTTSASRPRPATRRTTTRWNSAAARRTRCCRAT